MEKLLENRSKISVCVFAHNESKNIIRCLESLEGSSKHTLCIRVVANGCKDDTVSVASNYRCSDSKNIVEVIDLDIGDKANAWNHYVYSCDLSIATHIFIDGDCYTNNQSIELLATALNQPDKFCAAATPHESCGRNSKSMRNEMIINGGLCGNLYALSATFLRKVVNSSIKIPVGLIGEDSFLGSLVCWNLDNKSKWQSTNTNVQPNAHFFYDSFSVSNINDITTYWKRCKRYELRNIQMRLLNKHIKDFGLFSLPLHVEELLMNNDQTIREIKPSVHPVISYFTKKKLLKDIASKR